METPALIPRPERTLTQDLIDELNRQGHDIVYNRVPAEAYDQFYPGAAELR